MKGYCSSHSIEALQTVERHPKDFRKALPRVHQSVFQRSQFASNGVAVSDVVVGPLAREERYQLALFAAHVYEGANC